MSAAIKWTADALNAWHKAMVAKHGWVIPRLACADGYEVSIQASAGHYCAPRLDDGHPYSSFELGYPTAADEEFTDYADDPERPLDTVYGRVPVDVILQVLEKHGGPKR